MPRACAYLAGAICLVVASSAPAFAQPDGPDQHSEAPGEEAPSTDETLAELSAGGLLNTGNTESWQAQAGGRTRILRGPHAFSAELQFAYGQADLPEDMASDYRDTVKQLNARARYDFFFTDDDAVFVGEVYRWDPLAGIDTRLQTQAGYLRNLFREENHRFWVEVGYDFTYDNYHFLPSAMGAFVEEDYIHSARGFVGYDNRVNEHVSFDTGLEALVNVEDGDDVRVSWDSALRSSIAGQLQLEVSFSLKLDNVPPQGAEKLDTVTQLNLIYTLMDDEVNGG
ncbi:MAG: DUF481 domain-containing protein [Polyangiales bacterium]